MSNAISGKNGTVYANSLVVEDCEDVWTTGGAGSTISTTTGKVGTNATRATTVGVGANALLMYEDFGSTNLTAYDAVAFWIRSSVNTASGDLQLLLDDTSACASALESMDIPALTAATWTRVLLRISTPANLTAIISVGLKQVTDLADGTFDVDDVRAVKKVDEATDWTITFTGETADVTSFDSAGWREFLATLKGFSATWRSFKTGVPMTEFGTKALMAFEENSTVGRAWLGDVQITGLNETVSANGDPVAYDYSGQGTGELQVPIA